MKLHLQVNRSRRIKKTYISCQENFDSKATELYLTITKEEFDFQNERLENLLDDFSQDRDEIPLTQVVNDEEPCGDGGVLTERPLTKRIVSHRDS